jgi:hypothetical protein
LGSPGQMGPLWLGLLLIVRTCGALTPTPSSGTASGPGMRDLMAAFAAGNGALSPESFGFCTR